MLEADVDCDRAFPGSSWRQRAWGVRLTNDCDHLANANVYDESGVPRERILLPWMRVARMPTRP